MRLLLASAAHHPSHGGIGTAVSALIEHASGAGWHIELITRPSAVLPRCATIHLVDTFDHSSGFQAWIAPLRRLHLIRPYRYGSWSLAVAQKLLAIRGSVDAIGFVDSQAEGYIALTSKAVRDHWAGTPMFVHAHTPMWLVERISGFDEREFGRATYYQWEREALEACDGVIAPSKLLLRALQPSCACAAIPHLLNRQPDVTWQPQGVLLFVGNIEPHKGADVWARSLNDVLRRHGTARAVMIGRDTLSGPRGASMRETITTMIDRDLRDRWGVFDPMTTGDVQSWMARAAAVVVPSRFESFSYVAAEAIALGAPVIASNQIGLAEFVRDLHIFRTEDSKALAAAQCDVLEHPDRAAQRALRCRRQLHEACAADAVLRRFQEFIHELKSCPRVLRDRGEDTLDQMRLLLGQFEREAGMKPRTASLHAAVASDAR